MAVRDDFTAGEVLAAADLNDTFASKPPFSYGTATPTTTVDGFIWYDENDTPPAPKFWDGAAFQTFGGGKVLQVVRATDVTQRTTTSTSFVDVTGMSVTITPTKNTSIILINAVFAMHALGTGDDNSVVYQITDSSNTALSGAEGPIVFSTSNGLLIMQNMVGYSAPATTSAVTYKLRFKRNTGTEARVRNDLNTGQLIATEVAA